MQHDSQAWALQQHGFMQVPVYGCILALLSSTAKGLLTDAMIYITPCAGMRTAVHEAGDPLPEGASCIPFVYGCILGLDSNMTKGLLTNAVICVSPQARALQHMRRRLVSSNHLLQARSLIYSRSLGLQPQHDLHLGTGNTRDC